MEKYLLLWEFDWTKIPVDPKERRVGFDMLMEVIKQDIEKGILKDWGVFVGKSHGYSVVQGTEREVIKTSQRYTPFIYSAAHPIASITHAGEVIKALTK
jgi:hypothetical protein